MINRNYKLYPTKKQQERSRQGHFMRFKNNSDRELVIRSLLMLTYGDKELAAKSIDESVDYESAIRFIFCQQGQTKYCKNNE